MTAHESSSEKKIEAGAMNSIPLPDPNKSFASQEPDVLLAMCLFGEARGESDDARRAVAQVVLNRAQFAHPVFGSRPGADFAENLRRVILKPRQFSCFLPGDPNCAKLLRPLDHERPEVWARCLRAAQEALANRDQQDTLTHNSDHYFDDSLQPPHWADPAKQTVQIGRLRFYRLYLPMPKPEAVTPPSRRESILPAASREAVPQGTAEREAPALRGRVATGPALRPVLRSLDVRGSFSAGGLRMSHPAPHLPRQRTPRLGFNRWFQWSRGLSTFDPSRACPERSRRDHEGAIRTL
jgi:spore germination cell wall hydrolase CwlJ-like protein